MKKDKKRLLTGVAGAGLLLNACGAARPLPAGPAASEPISTVAESVPAAAEGMPAAAERTTEAARGENGALTISGYSLEMLLSEEETEYIKVAHAAGEFSFDQDVVTPPDEVFNIFGTALTGVCAKPSFSLGAQESGDYYINVSGNLKHAYRINPAEKREQEVQRVMACSCATGSAVVNAEVTGIPLSSLLRLDELEENVNTITFRGADGFGLPMPLRYALQREAMLVYQIGGEELPDGQRNQIWVPDAVAKYFTRNIVEIELTAEEEEPQLIPAENAYRAKVGIVNRADGASFAVGDAICFEGYADDCGQAIAAVEFSLDGGETWTGYETAGASSERWVYWYFTYSPETAGTYKLSVRAVTEDGAVSPLASALVFEVGEGGL